jgi:tyrosinase
LASALPFTLRGIKHASIITQVVTSVQQTLYGIIQTIASQFPADTKARYVTAASTFRIPYWDWAATPVDGDYFPTSVGSSATVSVISPTSAGKPVSIANPLYQTTFHPLNPVAGDFTALQGVPVSVTNIMVS